MGAYFAAAVVALVALALALWLGWPDGPAAESSVELAADSPFSQAALDDGHRQFILRRGKRLPVPPGAYRITLLAPDGRGESRRLEVGEGPTLVR